MSHYVIGNKPAALSALFPAVTIAASDFAPVAMPIPRLLDAIVPPRKPRRTFEPHDGDRARARRLRQLERQAAKEAR